MRKETVLIFAVLVAICTAGTAVVAADDNVALTVSVVNEDGDPVGGATVEATWDDGEAARTTASNGKVFIDVPRGADVELDIDDDRYVRNQPLTVQNATERDVELRVFQRGEATVTVTDTDGAPLSDATVTLMRESRTVSSGETDDDGTFNTGTVEQGEYRVSAVKPGFFRAESDLTVDEETEYEIAIEAGRVTLDVNVVDDHFEEPRTLTGARVLVESEPFDANVSASDGSASLNVPVNTRYRISPTKPGYDGTARSMSVREQPRSVTVSAQRTPELTLSVSNRRVIVGETTRVTVTNAYDEPVPDVTVRLDGDQVGETDDRGELSVSIDTVGEQTVTASDGTLDSNSVTVTGVDPDSDAEPEPEPEPEPSEPEPEPEPEDTPGFGIAAAVLALIALFAVRTVRNG